MLVLRRVNRSTAKLPRVIKLLAVLGVLGMPLEPPLFSNVLPKSTTFLYTFGFKSRNIFINVNGNPQPVRFKVEKLVDWEWQEVANPEKEWWKVPANVLDYSRVTFWRITHPRAPNEQIIFILYAKGVEPLPKPQQPRNVVIK